MQVSHRDVGRERKREREQERAGRWRRGRVSSIVLAAMEEGGGAKRSIREEEEGSSPQRNNGDMREEESEVTAVEGHSDILFDAATYAFEGHLMDRYRNLMAPIFEDVLRNVHARFLTDYKVKERRRASENIK